MLFQKLLNFNAIALASTLLVGMEASARTVEYDLTISEQTLAPAGRNVRVLAINGGIPGPTLRFTEGDEAVIRVHNQQIGRAHV